MGSERWSTNGGGDDDARRDPDRQDDRDDAHDPDAPADGVPVAEALASRVAVGRGPDEPVPSWLDAAVQYTWRGLVIMVGIAAALFVLTRLYLVSLPIMLALILATLCVPPARRLEGLGLPRLAAALIVVLGGIGSFVGVGALLAPTFIDQGRELQPSVAEGLDSVLMWLEEGPIGYDRTEVEQLFNQALATLEDQAGSIASSVGSIAVAIGQGIAALSLAIVLLFFFVKDGEQIVAWFIKLVPEEHSNAVRAAGTRGWVALSGFVRGTALVALIDALGIGTGLFILGIPAYLPLAVLIFFGGFIPVIGATVTGLLAVLVALASGAVLPGGTSVGGLSAALIVGGLVLLVQQVESNVLQPTIMRRAVALHPVVILAVLTAGAVLIGVVGAFLAVPLAAVAAAVGNELRLRHEVTKRGAIAGPSPIGGPGVDPGTVRVQFPIDTRLRAAGRRREGKPPRQRRTRKRTRTRELVEAEDVGRPLTPGQPTPERDPARDDEDDLALRTSDLRIPGHGRTPATHAGADADAEVSDDGRTGTSDETSAARAPASRDRPNGHPTTP